MLLGPGQGGDSPMFGHVLAAINVPRHGPGRPRSRPDRVAADKAYSSRSNRELLRRRGISAVIPEPSDQVGHRKRRASKGGRPVSDDTEAHRGRNVVERSFNVFKQWRGLATRYDELAITIAAASSWHQSRSGYANKETRPSAAGRIAGRFAQSTTLAQREQRARTSHRVEVISVARKSATSKASRINAGVKHGVAELSAPRLWGQLL